ncbi:MAG: leucine-rich repeat protein [Prevotella sp.]
MKHLPSWLGIFPLLFLLFFTACSDDENFSRITEDEATQKLLEQQQVFVSPGDTTFTLRFNETDDPWTAKLTSATDDHGQTWCKVSVTGNNAVTVSVQANGSFNMRHASIALQHGRKTYTFKVSQMYKRQMKALVDHVDIEATAREAFVYVRTNVMPEVSISASATWLKKESFMVEDHNVRPTGEAKVLIYRFTCEPNTGLGRAATLHITAEGAETQTVIIHQWPRELKETEEIDVREPGTLGILVGGNAADWSHVRTLRLSGTLNDGDIETLRSMLCPMVDFTQSNANGTYKLITQRNLNLQHVDLGQCKLIGGGQKFVEPSIGTNITTTYNTHSVNTLGDNAFFITRTPLASIVLPAELETIGGWLFNFCESLTKIDIPASVRHIGPYAFHNCTRLTEINIPADSRLETIGYCAFDTGTRVHDLAYPASLVLNENNGFSGNFHAERVHVKWAVPPVLKTHGVGANTVLYVPRGTGALYRAANGWKRAKDIIEE